MATVLSYAPPDRLRLRRYLGPIAMAVTVSSSILVVAATFYTRYALESYVQVQRVRCGTPHATLEAQLYELPGILFVPCFVGACVADRLHHDAGVSRVALSVAILGWAVCAFMG